MMYTQQRVGVSFLLMFSIILLITRIVSARDSMLKSEEIKNISCEKALELIEEYKTDTNFVVIDFRSENFYKVAHIEDAIFHDVFAQDIDQWLQSLNRDKTYLIYCIMGKRSAIALAKMEIMNFNKIYHMYQGLSQWKKLGYKTVSDLSDQDKFVSFDSEKWQVYNGQIVEYQGRTCLAGTARLKDVEFENGIIEFDISVTGERSYPGIRFRVQSGLNAENVYIRPHIIGLSPDALQYTPIFNNEACWQLYNGDGFTSGLEMPLNEWVHVKLEVSGSQARVYIGDQTKATLKIEYLKHGRSKGGIVLTAPPNASAHFSNFKIDKSTKLNFEPPLKEITPPGMLLEWEISQPFKYSHIDLEKTPIQQGIKNIDWQRVACETSGLVNISRYIKRQSREPDFIFAKTMLESDKPKKMELKFGYSDWIVIFLNGDLLFSGSSPYKGRDPSFLGIIGLFDTVMLPLKKGENELMLLVGESFGGWGFMCQDGKTVYQDKNLEKLWESKKIFSTSESVLYDPKREVLYVTNFDQFNVGNPRTQQFISKVTLSGEIEDLKWIDSLNNPLGMTFYEDALFVAERNSVAEIDLDESKISKRYPISGSVFLNDVAIDDSRKVYITDSRKNVIWRLSDGKAEVWLAGMQVSDPNVIYYHDNKIFFGNSGDRSLKSVDPVTKTVELIAKFEKGFIDGFRIDKMGNYLVSLWHGVLYRVTPTGDMNKILDTTAPGIYSADFEYIPEKDMLIIPTFFNNTITAYKMME